MRTFSAVMLTAFLCTCLQAQTRPTILVTSGVETLTTTNSAGAATKLGPAVVGSAATNTSTYEHSETWEVVRRFTSECPAAAFVTNPATPHSMTVHADFEKVGSLITGKITLYQLSLLDESENPVFVAKKNYLYRQIKPVCKVIADRTK